MSVNIGSHKYRYTLLSISSTALRMCKGALLSFLTLFRYYLILKSLFITLRLWSKREEPALPTTQKTRHEEMKKNLPTKGLHKHKSMITCASVQDISFSGLKLSQFLRARPSFRLQTSRPFFLSQFPGRSAAA